MKVRVVRPRPLLPLVFLLCVSLALAGCSQTAEEPTADSGTAIKATPLILASTTSTQDSGLFDELIPAFEEAYPAYDVKVVAVGTGEALRLGETKDADVLLVHALADEEKFVAAGFGIDRRNVMYNDFVIVGPAEDPAGVGAAQTAVDALAAVASAQAVFISRGDDSGTHKKELALWKAAGVSPEGDWYVEVGQGMGETLKIASEKLGYTLADRATYLAMREALDSQIVFQRSDDLLNQYGVIRVAGAVETDGATAFADWIVSPKGQAVIDAFGIDTYGEPLFVPNAE